jgi:hypothetical protein
MIFRTSSNYFSISIGQLVFVIVYGRVLYQQGKGFRIIINIYFRFGRVNDLRRVFMATVFV